MKELSIEEKAKRYDEALAKAKESIAYIPNDVVSKYMLNMFPELKDEDEKIRREIIDFATKANNGVTSILANNYDFNKWLAWLEKQGEKKNNVKVGEKYKCIASPVYTCFMKGEIYEVKSSFVASLINICPSCFELVTDEQNQTLQDGSSIGTGIPNWIPNWTKHQLKGEHKPADKVEPKFKVSEWLTENHPNSYARFVQILEIVNVQGKNRYRISRDLHNDEDIVECQFIEDNWHSFNIKDIREGDVLVGSDGSVFIYAGSTDTYAKFYVALTKCGTLNLEGGNWEDKNSVYPATKEQRDTLMKSMADAGWEFDFEKKELKKIEHNTAWSEEIYRKCICAMRASACGFPEEENFVEQVDNWLKSLRPQNHWKPSDEQMDAIDYVKNFDYGGYKDMLVSLYYDLKKLKDE